MSSDEDVLEVWCDAIQFAFVIAKGARHAELRGDRRIKPFDPRGLHLYSVEWGRALACEQLLPELEGVRGLSVLDPVTMRALAAREAEEDFLDDVRRGRAEFAHSA